MSTVLGTPKLDRTFCAVQSASAPNFRRGHHIMMTASQAELQYTFFTVIDIRLHRSSIVRHHQQQHHITGTPLRAHRSSYKRSFSAHQGRTPEPSRQRATVAVDCFSGIFFVRFCPGGRCHVLKVSLCTAFIRMRINIIQARETSWYERIYLLY